MNPNTIVSRPVNHIAHDIFTECLMLGIHPSEYLMSYLIPLAQVQKITDSFGHDSVAGIAAYCLDAMDSQEGWAGPRATVLTTELRDQVASVDGEDFDDPGIDE